MNYQSHYQFSIDNPKEFWRQQAQDLDWYKFPENILSQDDDRKYQWFRDGQLNTSYLTLDYHVNNGLANQLALIYDSPVAKEQKTYTYQALLSEVEKCAGAMQSLGIAKGDAVVIYMSMIPEAVIAMLACARLGAIHCVVFGGFSAKELAIRISDIEPKLIIASSCGIEIDKVIEYKPLLDKAIELSSCDVDACIIVQRPQAHAVMIENRDYDWHKIVAAAYPVDAVVLNATDPLYVLYTSGTTGKPKGVVRQNGGHAVALKYSFSSVYNLAKGDVFFVGSDVGWVVGHSYIVYGPLLQGCTSILFEGKPVRTPDSGAFWRLVESYKAKAIFSAPTAFRAIKREDYDGEKLNQYDLSSLQTIFVAGERLDPPTYHWLVEKTNKTIVDHWWQTETGWPIVANMCGIEAMPCKAGSSSVPVPGYDIKILDDEGNEVAANVEGNIAIKLPLPPGCLTTVWKDEARYQSSYLKDYPGFYSSGDGGYIDEDGYVFVMGRTDDVINVAGHRLSTGEMEEIIGAHKAVAECAVVGIHDDLKGQVPFGLVLLKDNINIDKAQLEQELIATIRENIGAIACYKQTLIVKRLPKTRSGKILRKTLRQLINGEDYMVPSTIDEPSVLDTIKAQLA